MRLRFFSDRLMSNDKGFAQASKAHRGLATGRLYRHHIPRRQHLHLVIEPDLKIDREPTSELAGKLGVQPEPAEPLVTAPGHYQRLDRHSPPLRQFRDVQLSQIQL
ncbi:hypothetical protein D3C81_2044270 [compost metagenome]